MRTVAGIVIAASWTAMIIVLMAGLHAVRQKVMHGSPWYPGSYAHRIQRGDTRDVIKETWSHRRATWPAASEDDSTADHGHSID